MLEAHMQLKPKKAISHAPSQPQLFFFFASPCRTLLSLSHRFQRFYVPLCCRVITADALGALFSSFPSPSVSAVRRGSLCPPNAALSLPQSTLGGWTRAETKGQSAGLAHRTLACTGEVKRSQSFMSTVWMMAC